MLDAIEIVKQVGYTLDIGYWLIDLERRLVYWPKGLGRPRTEVGDRGYQASPLDKMIERVDPEDQGRFRAFLAGILAGGRDEAIEITHLASWGEKVALRLAGRRSGHGHDTKIIGLVEVIDRWREHERLAKNLGFIVEALFISSDAGIVIFDGQMRVRRLNRNALDLFGVTEAEEESGDWAAIIEKRLPKATRDLLMEAIETSSAVSGTLSLGGLGGPRLAWRANPWGDGVGDSSGLVMTFNAKRQIRLADLAEREALRAATPKIDEPPPPPEPELPPAHVSPVGEDEAQARHRALEWVKHPILLVSIATGEIAFANRSARDLFHLPAEKRCFVENVYDLSGFTCDVDPLVIAAGGGHVLRLRLGARVGRMFDYDSDLLFVEYHDVVQHSHPQATMRTEQPKASTRAPMRAQPVVARPGAR
ncbi:MAG: PAS domain-containing protein [Hyphomicrobiales bacterium]|nr:PAS domain-containing protein [Hyphomicrobiales bacterium]